jgi:hypothetical protein
MTAQGQIVASNGGAETSSVARFGFWAALATGLSTLVTFAIAIAPPPLSGQLCKEGCLSYPYLDIAVRFPRDYFWLFRRSWRRSSTWLLRSPCTPV